jgi:hypothetical protein
MRKSYIFRSANAQHVPHIRVVYVFFSSIFFSRFNVDVLYFFFLNYIMYVG